MRPTTRSFRHAGHRLVYDEYGSGERVVILLPALLFSRTMHGPLASTLAAAGYRVVCLDLLGHGASDRPREMTSYSMTLFGQQVLALMDHLGLERTVVGGTSLGANAALEVVAADPDRVRGMLIEMPVLDNALLGSVIAFTPLLAWLRFGGPLGRALSGAAAAVPRQGPLLGRMLLDWASQDPEPSASVLQGLFFGRVAPPGTERRTFAAPTLIIGHQLDPIHPFSDSAVLARELPDARLLEASSILELRLSPERLTGEIVRFVEGCFEPRQRGRRAAREGGSEPSRNGSQRRRTRQSS